MLIDDCQHVQLILRAGIVPPPGFAPLPASERHIAGQPIPRFSNAGQILGRMDEAYLQQKLIGCEFFDKRTSLDPKRGTRFAQQRGYLSCLRNLKASFGATMAGAIEIAASATSLYRICKR